MFTCKLHSFNSAVSNIEHVQKAIVKSSAGEITILPQHCNLLTGIISCKLFIDGGEIIIIEEIANGILLVQNEQLNIECDNFILNK